jgi:hypothetical protein
MQNDNSETSLFCQFQMNSRRYNFRQIDIPSIRLFGFSYCLPECRAPFSSRGSAHSLLKISPDNEHAVCQY